MLNEAVRLQIPAATDLTAEAAATLQVCWAAFHDSGEFVWASEAFAERLPEIASRDAGPDALNGLPDLLGEGAHLADGDRTSALLTRKIDGRIYEGELVRRGPRLFLSLEDAAERQEAQQRRLADRERLLITSRVLSVGEMASMLAHELNQPIGSITNLVRGLKARLQRDALDKQSATEALQKASEQALYASGVIQRIRSFVEARQPRVEPLDLADLARCTLDLLDWEIARDRVDARSEVPADLPRALGDKVMIQQVLVNLARNALDAMRTGSAERRLHLSGRAEGGRIELSIRDSGPGVSDEAAAKLFSPFYSTKAGGMGVGLGICRSIVEIHAGRLWFTRNTDGPGSTFHLALPAAATHEAS